MLKDNATAALGFEITEELMEHIPNITTLGYMFGSGLVLRGLLKETNDLDLCLVVENVPKAKAKMVELGWSFVKGDPLGLSEVILKNDFDDVHVDIFLLSPYNKLNETMFESLTYSEPHMLHVVTLNAKTEIGFRRRFNSSKDISAIAKLAWHGQF